ncbi:hypothetical protein [Streptomyces wuyuanensis]|uniref:hypothetical protein n=1 Tax=Streptomyces wuyuanensis TaxID=1196353 RepID=UPI0037A42FD1
MVTVSTLVVLGLVVVLLVWKAGLPWYMAAPCVLFGLLLADTPAGPALTSLLDGAADAVSAIRL